MRILSFMLTSTTLGLTGNDSVWFEESLLYPLLLTSIVTGLAFWLDLRRRLRADRVGKCQSCYYDTTGNASGVCPECGKRIACRQIPIHPNPTPPPVIVADRARFNETSVP